MPRPTLEICVASVAESLTAEQCGADRLELNSGLPLGGLTPSLALAQRVNAECGLPVVVMARPRPGGFCYSEDDWKTLLLDVEAFQRIGVHGIAFGCLTETREIDVQRIRQLTESFGQLEYVFHRAFDLVADWKSALDQLVECRVARVMTSGFAENVPSGLESIAEIIRYARGRIEVIPAGGINEANVLEVIAQTGCDQVHGTFSSEELDPGYLSAPIRFATNDGIRRVDAKKVTEVIKQLNSLSE